jgi:hypothetical protein
MWTIAERLLEEGMLPATSSDTLTPVALSFSEDDRLAAIAFLYGGSATISIESD